VTIVNPLKGRHPGGSQEDASDLFVVVWFLAFARCLVHLQSATIFVSLATVGGWAPPGGGIGHGRNMTAKGSG
jgi:hypothetical protein